MSGAPPFANFIQNGRSNTTELLRSWEATLDTLRFGLNRNLAGANLISTDHRDALLSVFCDELVVAQQKFLHQAEAMGFASTEKPIRGEIVTQNKFAAGELATACAAGLASAWFASGWVVATTTATTGMLFWKTTTITSITLVMALSTKLGLPGGLVVVGIFALVAFICWKLVRAVTIGTQRTLMRRHILTNFDASIRPQLLNWAKAVVAEA